MGNCINIFSYFYNKEEIVNNDDINDSEKTSESDTLTIDNIKKNFIFYNILDTNKYIIIGILNNSNKTNTLNDQSIWIENHPKIYKLKFGLKSQNIVILHFENNIVLKITKNEHSFLLELKNKENTLEYSSNISNEIIKKLNKINYNSLDLDLIFEI